MSILRVLPAAALVGAAGIVALGVSKALDELFDDDYDFTPNDEQDAKLVMDKMIKVQNELARLSDIKDLNDRRESTGQLVKATIQVEGVEINELIASLTEEIDRLTKLYNTLNKQDGGKKRKKKH